MLRHTSDPPRPRGLDVRPPAQPTELPPPRRRPRGSGHLLGWLLAGLAAIAPTIAGAAGAPPIRVVPRTTTDTSGAALGAGLPARVVPPSPPDDDAEAMARLRASMDPAIVELVRTFDERERRLASLRTRRFDERDPMQRLAIQREGERVKRACQRAILTAQLERARGRRDGAATARELERHIARLDADEAARRQLFEARGSARRTR